jgi:hypothetical protein
MIVGHLFKKKKTRLVNRYRARAESVYNFINGFISYDVCVISGNSRSGGFNKGKIPKIIIR